MLPLARRLAASVNRPAATTYADAVQDAAAIVLQVRGEYNRPLVPYARWLWMRARGRLLDQYASVINKSARQYLQDARPPAVSEGGDRSLTSAVDDRGPEQADIAIDVREAIARLPEPQRTVVSLYFLSGWTQARIAAHRGVGQPAVCEMLARAKVTLRETLHDHAV